jgi:AbrB family looped-hinge helix DNA binding protein
MKTSLSSKGQLVLPAELRVQDGLKPGQQFEIQRVQSGEYLLKKISGSSKPGLIDLLLSCPEKGWFQEIPSESTADLK